MLVTNKLESTTNSNNTVLMLSAIRTSNTNINTVYKIN
jgi:hypothetical protein